tara:strand:- start:571 stop:1758 length:1188 start_codon:yes stop_codon:yes gene_type:complete
MSLRDKFRIKELTSFGQQALRKDEKGIVVKRKDGKEVKPKDVSVEDRILSKTPKLGKLKKKNPIIIPDEKQESYSGEVSDYVERLKYNEEELKKALDVDVDELIKAEPKDLPKIISRKAFERLQGLYQSAQENILNLTNKLKAEESKVSGLETTIADLQARLAAAQAAQLNAEQELIASNAKFASLLIDFQNALSKGIQEGTERVSLESQLRGLQAEKITFKEVVGNYEKQLLQSQERIAELNQNILQLQSDVTQAQRDAIRANQSAASNSGGKIICNELYKQGYLPEEIWDADERWGAARFITDPKLVVGYQMWARKVVKFMRKNPQWTPTIYFLCKPWTEWMAYDIGVLPKNNLRGQFTQWVGRYFSYFVFDMYGGQKLLDKYNYKLFKQSWQ